MEKSLFLRKIRLDLFNHQLMARYKTSNYSSFDPITPSCNKTIYNTQEEAQDVIRHITETRVVRELYAYECETCGMWHLSSKSR